MEVLMETLQNGTSAEKATALEKFNQTYDNYNVDNVSTPVIECKWVLEQLHFHCVEL